MKTSKGKQVYVNPKQLQFLQGNQRRKSFIGGRGSGKSSALGFEAYIDQNHMPRSKWFIGGLTYNHILTKTLPAVLESWESLGLKEFDPVTKLGHFVVCRRPPSNFATPFQSPRKYDNVISFINGYTLEMLSMDVKDNNRGGSYDGGHIDESALVNEEFVNRVLLPSIRGNIYRFSNPRHQKLCDYSSAAWLPSGQWIYKTEELAKQSPQDYLFVEARAHDNIEVLGKGYLDKLRAMMSKLEYDVEVDNKRLKKLPNGFYPAFNEDIHGAWFTYDYGYNDETGLWLSNSNFIDHSDPLDVSFDFNAAFTSMICCQERGLEFRVDDVLFCKESSTNLVDELANIFIAKYINRPNKHINIYGDRNGNNKSAGNNHTFFEMIIIKLRASGFTTELLSHGLDSEHKNRHVLANAIMSEDNPRLPRLRINLNNCKPLVLSIQNAPMLPDWKKDKRSETQNIPQETATHLSDTLDAILWTKYASLLGYEDYSTGVAYFI